MSGFIIALQSQPLGFPTSWLERVPVDGSLQYFASTPSDATVFTEAMAQKIAAMYQGVAMPDPFHRTPEAYTDGR